MAPSTKNKTASLDLAIKNSYKNRKVSGSCKSSYDPLKS